MKNAVLIVSDQELKVIKKLLAQYKAADLLEKRNHERLTEELKKAQVKPELEMPGSVVRLNSIVSVETSFGRKDGLQLVVPAEANMNRRKLSVMSAMGSALYGYAEGDKVVWNLPGGEEEIVIKRVINEL